MEKKPFLTLQQAQEISKTYPTPFHIYDEKAIRENARKVKAAFAWNPGYKEYFAVKATPNPRLVQILHEEGFGCDCSSYTELQLSRACGITGHDIMFSSNVTPNEDFKLASDLDAIVNFDDITHLDYYDKVGEWKETMSCRFNPGGDFVLENEIMDTPQEAKYGMTREQLIETFKYMKQKGVKHFGIHAFLASNTVANEYYPALARILFKLAVEVQKETGVHIAFINLSGGGVLTRTRSNSPSTSARRASLPAIARHSCDCTPQEDRNCASIACVFSVEETTRIRSMTRISPPFGCLSSVRSKADARQQCGRRPARCGHARPAWRRKRLRASFRAGILR